MGEFSERAGLAQPDIATFTTCTACLAPFPWENMANTPTPRAAVLQEMGNTTIPSAC